VTVAAGPPRAQEQRGRLRLLTRAGRAGKNPRAPLYICVRKVYSYYMNATHYDASIGLRLVTACGKSLHGWANISRRKPIVVELRDKNQVTCKRCLKKI
jgi:hypothetical protein